MRDADILKSAAKYASQPVLLAFRSFCKGGSAVEGRYASRDRKIFDGYCMIRYCMVNSWSKMGSLGFSRIAMGNLSLPDENIRGLKLC